MYSRNAKLVDYDPTSPIYASKLLSNYLRKNIQRTEVNADVITFPQRDHNFIVKFCQFIGYLDEINSTITYLNSVAKYEQNLQQNQEKRKKTGRPVGSRNIKC
jgi:hypothetical protein